MKIEVGKSYINAEGNVVKIVRNNPAHPYPYICRHYSYTEEGIRINNQQCPQDLICEVVPEIYEAYTLGYILSQREFIERHIKHWTENEQTNL